MNRCADEIFGDCLILNGCVGFVWFGWRWMEWFVFNFLFFNHGDVNGWGCVEVGVITILVGGSGGKSHVICG